MTDERLRVGIVGASINAGWGPQTHVPAIKALPEYELTAVCTTHEDSARASAEKFGARLAFHDHREMVNHPEIDVVVVSVKVPTHYQVAMDALNAGKHVYCEWPLAANLQQAQEMADLARAKGLRAMVGLQARASPVHLRLKELVEEGYVGQVLACHMVQFTEGRPPRTANMAWQADPSSGYSTLTVHFGHATDIFCHCLGEFSELSAVVSAQISQWDMVETGQTLDVTAPDNVLVSGRLEGGAVASVHVSSRVSAHASGYRLEVYGREGTLVMTSQVPVHREWPRLLGGKAGDSTLQELPIPDRLTWVPEGVPQGTPFNAAQMHRRLAEAIRTEQQAEPSLDTAVRLHKLLDTIQRASDEGRQQVVSL